MHFKRGNVFLLCFKGLSLILFLYVDLRLPLRLCHSSSSRFCVSPCFLHNCHSILFLFLNNKILISSLTWEENQVCQPTSEERLNSVKHARAIYLLYLYFSFRQVVVVPNTCVPVFMPYVPTLLSFFFLSLAKCRLFSFTLLGSLFLSPPPFF